jgi:hypothetical protein
MRTSPSSRSHQVLHLHAFRVRAIHARQAKRRARAAQSVASYLFSPSLSHAPISHSVLTGHVRLLGRKKRTLQQAADGFRSYRYTLRVAEQSVAQSAVLSITTGQDLNVPDRCSIVSLDGEERQVTACVQVDALGAGVTWRAPP